MVADVLTGSMLVALGFAAALTVVAGFALRPRAARLDAASGPRDRAPHAVAVHADAERHVPELRRSRSRSTSCSARCSCAGCAPTRPVRSSLSGLVLGAAFLTRPYDAVLFALPFAVYIIATRRHDLPRRSRGSPAGSRSASLPAIVGTLAYNVGDDRQPARRSRSRCRARASRAFGWGVRSIAPDTPKLDFNVVEAFELDGHEPLGAPDLAVRHVPHARGRGLRRVPALAHGPRDLRAPASG